MWILLGLPSCVVALSTGQLPRVGGPMPEEKPSWFRAPAPAGQKYDAMKAQLGDLALHTVCTEAACPNVGECWNGGTATIMLLGDTCTRGCHFCNVKTSATPIKPDPDEPMNAATAVAQWSNCDYVVLTSVDRDDLPDGGADHFRKTVQLLKSARPDLLVECLVSDFAGDLSAVDLLATSGLDVYAHNVETVERLTPRVRDRRATYDQSLECLKQAKKANVVTKSSLMLGLGETLDEIKWTMADLRKNDVDVLTLGQYLRPTADRHLNVVEYIHPDVFNDLRRIGEDDFGFAYVASGPLVRSSYKAGEFFIKHFIQRQQLASEAPVASSRSSSSSSSSHHHHHHIPPNLPNLPIPSVV